MFIRGGGNPASGFNYGLEFHPGTRIDDDLRQAGDHRPGARRRERAGLQRRGHPAGPVHGRRLELPDLDHARSAPTSSSPSRAPSTSASTIAPTSTGGTDWNISTVGATFGHEVITSSYKAIAVALILIMVYISLRFAWKFAIGAIVAEFHDLFVVIGIYSLTGREVTTGTIAAVLTILGYSLYDTVIVFDRIRENAPKMSRVPYGDMVNRSIWETLTRSINTTLMTLIPVVCLLLFGGATLKDFAFALLVGVASGAYSSIFVASPVLTLLKEREPKYRKLALKAGELS